MSAVDTFHVVLDLKANIITCDGLASCISGYSQSEVIGKNWFKIFIPEENLEEILNVFDSFLHGDISFWEYENEIICKDGTRKLIHWKNSILRDSNNIANKISSQGTLLEYS